MPFNRPTLPELIERIAADLESRLPGSDARLRRTLLGILGRTLAGTVHGLYGYADFLAAQILPDTAEAEFLQRWSTLWGIVRRPASAASGDLTVSGSDGAALPAGTLLQRGDGAEYRTLEAAVIAAGTATVPVAAVLTGAAGNSAAGGALQLASPLAGIAPGAVVAASGLEGGADAEDDEALRQRLLTRLQQPPHGGTAADYEAWALQVPDITRAWCYPLNRGNGTVDVYAVCDALPSIIPAAGTVAALQAHLDSLRPVTADVLALAPTAAPLDFSITLNPPTALVRAAVAAELAELLRRQARPGDGLGAGTILLSHIREAISAAEGEVDHVLVAPVANVVPAAGAIVTLGEITWL